MLSPDPNTMDTQADRNRSANWNHWTQGRASTTAPKDVEQQHAEGCCFTCNKQGHISWNCLDKPTDNKTNKPPFQKKKAKACQATIIDEETSDEETTYEDPKIEAWVSRYNGSWLDSAWVVLGLSARRAARYSSLVVESRLASLVRWSCSLDQTTLCCSSCPWRGDRYSGYDELQWGAIVFMKSLSPGVTPKALSLRGIGLRRRDVVVLQEIEPKVCFPSTTEFIYIIEDTLKLLLNSERSTKP